MLSVAFTLQYNKVKSCSSHSCKQNQIDPMHQRHNECSVCPGRNTNGPPWSVGRPTTRAPGGRPAHPPAGIVTDDDRRRQTPVSKTILTH